MEIEDSVDQKSTTGTNGMSTAPIGGVAVGVGVGVGVVLGRALVGVAVCVAEAGVA